jgi:hypothetical protein
MTDTDKLSAMERAAYAVAKHAVGEGRAMVLEPYWKDVKAELVASTQVAVQAYLQALAEDEGTVEAMIAASRRASSPFSGDDFETQNRNAVRAALATLLQRAGDRG